MEKTYQFQNGEIKLLRCKYQYKIELKKFLNRLKLILLLCIIFILVCFITLTVYKKCILQPSLENTISLGAVFATLGSSLVAILSLACSEQYSRFMDNVRILELSLLKKNRWERWPFVNRIQRNKISKGEYHYYILSNPSIIFTNGQWEVKVLLPAGKNDFRELSLYRTIFKLITNQKKYNLLLLDRNEMHDKLIWDCLKQIYLNILLYRWYQIIVWMGACFVFSSIFFSFFYTLFF